MQNLEQYVIFELLKPYFTQQNILLISYVHVCMLIYKILHVYEVVRYDLSY